MIDLNWPVLTIFDEVTNKKKASYRSTLRWIKRYSKRSPSMKTRKRKSAGLLTKMRRRDKLAAMLSGTEGVERTSVSFMSRMSIFRGKRERMKKKLRFRHQRLRDHYRCCQRTSRWRLTQRRLPRKKGERHRRHCRRMRRPIVIVVIQLKSNEICRIKSI